MRTIFSDLGSKRKANKFYNTKKIHSFIEIKIIVQVIGFIKGRVWGRFPLLFIA